MKSAQTAIRFTPAAKEFLMPQAGLKNSNNGFQKNGLNDIYTRINPHTFPLGIKPRGKEFTKPVIHVARPQDVRKGVGINSGKQPVRIISCLFARECRFLFTPTLEASLIKAKMNGITPRS